MTHPEKIKHKTGRQAGACQDPISKAVPNLLASLTLAHPYRVDYHPTRIQKAFKLSTMKIAEEVDRTRFLLYNLDTNY